MMHLDFDCATGLRERYNRYFVDDLNNPERAGFTSPR
jgi:hypothetical protein